MKRWILMIGLMVILITPLMAITAPIFPSDPKVEKQEGDDEFITMGDEIPWYTIRNANYVYGLYLGAIDWLYFITEKYNEAEASVEVLINNNKKLVKMNDILTVSTVSLGIVVVVLSIILISK